MRETGQVVRRWHVPAYIPECYAEDFVRLYFSQSAVVRPVRRRRSWRERFFSLPWRPWQNSDLVFEAIETTGTVSVPCQQRGIQPMSNSDHETLAAMKRYGGSFVHKLAELCEHADATNLAKIKDTWPDYFDHYRKMAMDSKRRAEAAARPREENHR